MSQIIVVIEEKLELSLDNLEDILEGNTIQTATLIWATERVKNYLSKQ